MARPAVGNGCDVSPELRRSRPRYGQPGHACSVGPAARQFARSRTTGPARTIAERRTAAMVKISIYIDTGNVYEYDVPTEATAREHADAIIKTGYRSVQTDALTIL